MYAAGPGPIVTADIIGRCSMDGGSSQLEKIESLPLGSSIASQSLLQ